MKVKKANGSDLVAAWEPMLVNGPTLPDDDEVGVE
jgi:hypothetical protein